MDDLYNVVSNAMGGQQQANNTPDYGGGNQLSKRPIFDRAGQYGTPSKLLDNLMATESGGDPHAVNKETGAMGAYQFMPSTVSMLSKQGVKFDPFNANESRAAADYYIQQLASQNGGNLHKTMAQYGGFVTKDPSAYVGKVMNGVNQQATQDDPSAFSASVIDDALNGRIKPIAQAGSMFHLPQSHQGKSMTADWDAVPVKNDSSKSQTGNSSDALSIWDAAAGPAQQNRNRSALSIWDAAGSNSADWDAIPVNGGKSYTYTDESNNPNYKPDPSEMHIDISGTSNSGPSKFDRFGSAIGSALGSSATGSAILGGVKGAFDTAIDGPAQLLANGAADAYPKHWPGWQYLQDQKQIANGGVKERAANFAEATQDHPTAGKIGEVAGGVAGAFALPLGSVGEGAGLVSRLLAASKAGAVIGAAGPIEDPESFWAKKAIGTAVGAAGGLVGYPVGAAAGKVLGYAADKATGLAQPLINKFTGAGSSEMAAVANSSPELQAAVSRSVSKGEKINPDHLARQVEADSLPIQMSLTPGQAKQDPMLISTEMNMRSKNPALIQKFNDQNSQLIQNLDHIRDTGAPNAIAPDHITAGETLINSGQKIIDAQNAKTSSLYKALEDANGGSLPLDGQSFAVQANQALGKSMKGPFLPPQVQGILSDLQRGKQPMTFENFENLRTMLGAEARKADQAGDGNTLGAVNAVRNTLENMPLPDAAASLKPLADQARASAKQGFDMMRTNPLLGAIDSGKASADNLIQRYVVNGQKADLINLASTLKDDPVALETMKAGTINYLKNQAVGQTGNFSQANYNKSIQALGPKLDVLFGQEEAAQLRSVGNVARFTQLQPRGSYVNNSNTDVANLARGAGNMAGMAVNAATHSPVGSIVTDALQSAFEKRVAAGRLNQMLNPGAGISTPNPTSQFLQSRLPALSGTAASIPIASILSNFSTKKSDSQLGKRK